MTFFLCLRLSSSSFIKYPFSWESFKSSLYYFSNSSNSVYLSFTWSFIFVSLFILLFSCLMIVMFSINLFLVTFSIFSDNFRFSSFIPFSYSSSFSNFLFKDASWKIIWENVSSWLYSAFLFSFCCFSSWVENSSTLRANSLINPLLSYLSNDSSFIFFYLLFFSLLKPFLMAKMFSLIGIPSPKNWMKKEILFRVDRFDHDDLDLFLGVIWVPSLDTWFNLANLIYIDLIDLPL